MFQASRGVYDDLGDDRLQGFNNALVVTSTNSSNVNVKSYSTAIHANYAIAPRNATTATATTSVNVTAANVNNGAKYNTLVVQKQGQKIFSV